MTDEVDGHGDRRNGLVRSLLAAVLVAAGHIGAFAWLTAHSLSTQPPDSVLGAPIELDMLAVAPPEPPHDVAPAAPPAPQSTPEPPPPTPEAPPIPEPPPPPPEALPTPDPNPPPPPMQEPPPPAPAPEPTPELPTPTPTVKPPPDAVILPSAPPPRPSPTPRPTPPKPQNPKPPPTPKPDPEKVERDQERAEAKERARDARRRQRADAASHAATDAARARDDNRQAATQRPTPSGSDISSWRGEVMARISEFKPSSNGASGTAVVAFSVDSGGRVVSASLVRSCGDASLDAASVAMVRRASPVPPPPPGLGGHVNLSVPVRFQ